MKDSIKRKLTSRKFWTAVVSFITLLSVSLGATESEAMELAGIIMAGASVCAYIVGEGLADMGRENNKEDQ